MNRKAELAMGTITVQDRRFSEGRPVGRRRQPQPPEIRKTLTGKFGARLAGLADLAGLSADELGKKVGKSGDTVRLYYAGKVVPPLDDWPKLARALHVSVRELLPE